MSNNEVFRVIDESLRMDKVMTSYVRILPYIDPDSPRFIDWITAYRALHGRNTSTRHLRLPNEDGLVKIDNLIEAVDAAGILAKLSNDQPDMKFYMTEYSSNGIYRVLIWSNKVIGEKEVEVPELLIVMGRTSTDTTAVFIGRDELTKDLIEKYEDRFSTPEAIHLNTLVGFSQDGAPILNVSEFKKDDETINVSYDEFYPFIEGGIEKLIKEYMDDKAAVLVFVGAPGTGKSTLLRTMMLTAQREKNYSINDEPTLMNPATTKWLGALKRGSFVMIEDADNFCKSRDLQNHQMSSLLNTADGIGNRKLKIAISTNLPTVKDIDHALLRPGRAFKVIEFKRLNTEQANAARAKLGLEPIEDFGCDHIGGVTLSEALNYREGDVSRKRTGFGFGG